MCDALGTIIVNHLSRFDLAAEVSSDGLRFAVASGFEFRVEVRIDSTGLL